ncbi:MAG: helix-turn-helix domain-containing protein [Clostridia bacterium]|nr:helix-turn-helix domain-containing protein [Clostridia bacterium]MDE7208383.1 helix-turn-helix domain-containing protein [Clostridia bacterium]
MYNIGKELRYHRKVNNLSQKKIAQVLGVGDNAVSRWEIGDNTPSIYELIALADFYDISLDELIGRDYFGRL